MNEQKIRLRVVTVTTDADGEKRETKTAHRGILRASENGVELRYEQVDEGVRATIWLTQEAGCILMRRMGEMTGSLRFQPASARPASILRYTVRFPSRSTRGRPRSSARTTAAK